jgi:hypothetical protein
MIRTILAFAAAASLAAPTLPAFAQTLSTQPAPASWKPLPQRQDQVAAQIADGVGSGALSDLQARDLRDQFKGLLDLEDTYRKTGLTPAQRADLQARYDTLEARIQVESHPASVQVRRAPAATADTAAQ